MVTIRCRGQTFRQIQAVLFDKDGTLAEVETYLRALGELRSQFIVETIRCPATAEQLQTSLLLAFGLEGGAVDPAGLLAVASREENEVAAAAYLAATTGSGWVKTLTSVRAAFDRAKASLAPQATRTPLIEGSRELLGKLHSAGVQIGIVSADAHEEVAAFVEQYKLSEISWFCGAAPNTLPKTHPDCLRFVCQAMAIEPSQTLVIGDALSDLALAGQGAAGFIGVEGGWQKRPDALLAEAKEAIALPDAFPIATSHKLTELEIFN